ncbi:hypothetical protein F2Q70_00014245 [Brassica cretica]|uniref:Uncharacterized protein n=1 Tax=Brassica cretica TaxID=69181 RepID=A0A8S9I3M1_BRACR|nr:hypothetical protein F2Q70_00014245 [Brassica cretica]
MSTACTNALHPETRVKARVNHLPPAKQRRGDRSPPSAEPKPLKKYAQTKTSSRLLKSLTGPTPKMKQLLTRTEETDEAKEEESIAKVKNTNVNQRTRDNPGEEPPSTPKERGAES